MKMIILNINFIPDNVTPVYDPNNLATSVINNIKVVSQNKVNYQIVDNQTVTSSTTKHFL